MGISAIPTRRTLVVISALPRVSTQASQNAGLDQPPRELTENPVGTLSDERRTICTSPEPTE